MPKACFFSWKKVIISKNGYRFIYIYIEISLMKFSLILSHITTEISPTIVHIGFDNIQTLKVLPHM